MIRRGAGSIIQEHYARYLRIDVLWIPEALGWNGQYQRFSGEGVFRPRPNPTEELRPDILCLLSGQTLKQHPNIDCVVGAEVDLLAPVGIKEVCAIEAHHLGDQRPVSLIGRSSYRSRDCAKELGQFPRAQGKPGDDAEGAASADLDCPEQIRIQALVDDAHAPIGRDDFGLGESGGASAGALGPATEAASLYQSGHANRAAAAALHIPPALSGHHLVRIGPKRSGTYAYRGLWCLLALAALGDEFIVQRNGVHPPRPDQHRIAAIGRALVAMSAASDDQPHIVCAGEIDAAGDVSGPHSSNPVWPRLASPRIDPATRLRKGRLVANKVGVVNAL